MAIITTYEELCINFQVFYTENIYNINSSKRGQFGELYHMYEMLILTVDENVKYL